MTDLELIYCCAVRYSLNRTSYVPETIVEYLMKQELSEKCKFNIIKDIEECKNYGHDCDKASWMKLLKHLKK